MRETIGIAADPDDWWRETPIGALGCSSSDCNNNLHCFRRRRPGQQSYRNKTCVVCGADLVDWDRLDKKDLGDADYTIKSLKHEMFRNYYWGNLIDEAALRGARRRGLEGLKTWTTARLERVLRPPSNEIFRDGTQTPLSGNIVYYAQHGTATCCRKCLEEWHGIDRQRVVSQKDMVYFTDLIMLFTNLRTPSSLWE